MANFLNAVPDTDYVKETVACLNKALKDHGDTEIDLNDRQKIKASDLRSFTDNFNDENDYAFEIKGHKFVGFYIDDDQHDFDYRVNLAFDYPGNVNIDAPKDAKDILDLVKKLNDLGAFSSFGGLFLPSGTGDCSTNSLSENCGPTSSGNTGSNANGTTASRDLQRQSDLSRLIAAITNYQADNRNRIPDDHFDFVVGRTTPRSYTVSGWDAIYDDYLLKNGVFADPDGTPYSLDIDECDAEYGSCDDQGFRNFNSQNYTITVLTGATCQNGTAVPSTSPRKVAVLYHREAGSTNLCANN